MRVKLAGSDSAIEESAFLITRQESDGRPPQFCCARSLDEQRGLEQQPGLEESIYDGADCSMPQPTGDSTILAAAIEMAACTGPDACNEEMEDGICNLSQKRPKLASSNVLLAEATMHEPQISINLVGSMELAGSMLDHTHL